jgi:streptolysin S family bacteriocin protoxin
MRGFTMMIKYSLLNFSLYQRQGMGVCCCCCCVCVLIFFIQEGGESSDKVKGSRGDDQGD